MPRSSPLPVALSVSAAVALAATVGMHFYMDGVQAQSDAAKSAAEASPGVRCDTMHYQQQLNRDAAELGVAASDVSAMAAPLRGGVELAAPKVLTPIAALVTATPAPAKARPKSRAKVRSAGKGKGKGKGRVQPAVMAMPGGGLETEHLVLKLEVERLPKGREMADHLILSITNHAKVPVAYQVQTDPPAGTSCEGMFALPYNAIALLPGETVRRTECLAPAVKPQLRVRRVEAYEVTELGARYLRRLPVVEGPVFDARVTAAHRGEPLPLCPRDFAAALQGYKTDGFQVLVDFYARHSCQSYRLPAGYKPASMVPPVCSGAKAVDDQRKPPAVAAQQPERRGPRWPLAVGGVLTLILLAGAVLLRPRRQVKKAQSQAAVMDMKQEGGENLSDAYWR